MVLLSTIDGSGYEFVFHTFIYIILVSYRSDIGNYCKKAHPHTLTLTPDNPPVPITCIWSDGRRLVREGLAYRKGTDVPFTGKTTGKKQWSFKDGKKDGPSIEYHDNGQLLAKGNYKNGKTEGPWVEYHKNGQLWNKGTFKNDEMEGPWVSYLENGQLRSKGPTRTDIKTVHGSLTKKTELCGRNIPALTRTV